MYTSTISSLLVAALMPIAVFSAPAPQNQPLDSPPSGPGGPHPHHEFDLAAHNPFVNASTTQTGPSAPFNLAAGNFTLILNSTLAAKHHQGDTGVLGATISGPGAPTQNFFKKWNHFNVTGGSYTVNINTLAPNGAVSYAVITPGNFTHHFDNQDGGSPPA